MKLKSILVVAGLLGLGFVIGFLTSGQLMKSKVSRIAKTRTSEGLENHIFRIIDANEDQKVVLSEKIRPYTIELEKIRRESFIARKPIIDSMKMEIEKELSPEQAAKLDRFFARMKRGHPSKGKNSGNGKKWK